MTCNIDHTKPPKRQSTTLHELFLFSHKELQPRELFFFIEHAVHYTNGPHQSVHHAPTSCSSISTPIRDPLLRGNAEPESWRESGGRHQDSDYNNLKIQKSNNLAHFLSLRLALFSQTEAHFQCDASPG